MNLGHTGDVYKNTLHRNKMQRSTDRLNGKSIITPRPNASPGFWMGSLLPLAYGTNYLNSVSLCGSQNNSNSHKFLTIVAFTMFMESLCQFLIMSVETNRLFKWLLLLLPGATTGALFAHFLNTSWFIALSGGYAVMLTFHWLYLRLVIGLPYCFTFGEAAFVTQGLLLFVLNAGQRINSIFTSETAKPETDFEKLNLIMLCALCYLLLGCVLLYCVRKCRQPLAFYIVVLSVIFAASCAPVTTPIPIITLVQFIWYNKLRVYVIAFYLLLVGITIITVDWQMRNSRQANTRVRKIFHILIVFVYLPGLLFECELLYISTGIALAILTVIELMRILHIPPLAMALQNAFSLFKDEKDAGLLALTPFTLLIGCSLPIWIYPCTCSMDKSHILQMISGVLAVGIGDTAASVIGSKLGHNKWTNSNRSLEGTAAFIIAILMTVLCLNIFGLIPMTQAQWFVTIFASINTALVEAHIDQIDNLVLPLVFYIFVSVV